MAKLKEEFWKILQKLNTDDFESFKWFLKEDGILPGLSGIPVARLEGAARPTTVDLLVQTYQGGACQVTMVILEKIGRRDLVHHLENFAQEPEDARRGDFAAPSASDSKKDQLKRVQQFEVEVTLDPKSAHPNLVLSDDGKQVYHGDVRKELPNNPERFNSCVNVLGKQSFSSRKFYFEVYVKRKAGWALGVAKQSVKRKGDIVASPENGYWTIMLRNGQYTANDENPLHLPLNRQLHRVGVFVDYNDGLISFYDVAAAEILYYYTDCSFSGKIYPFFTPFTNDGGRNRAPLIICPVNQPPNITTQKADAQVDSEEHERKRVELESVQQFAVDVTLDSSTAHPALILSDDGKQAYCGEECKDLPYNPKRFNSCVNVLGEQSFSTGRFYFEVQVKGKTAWTVGVAKESIARKGDIKLSPTKGFWTIWLRNGDDCEAIDDPSVSLTLKTPLQKVGVFTDYEEGRVSFYDVDSAELLYSFTSCSFTDRLHPYLSPCTDDGGVNSAPLIITPVKQAANAQTHNAGAPAAGYERLNAGLMAIQKFEVEVTLDPDTAHPALFVSEDGKQVYDGDVWEAQDNPKRFSNCVNVLGKQGFSSGKFYFEVQVKRKTAWTVGVARESIKRKGQITLSPGDGFWTIWLRNRDDYMANDENAVQLHPNKHPQRVGVFVNYEEGLVSFYDIGTADLLYCFTDCTFTEKLYPFLSPCKNDGGTNSAPLIISPVNHPLWHCGTEQEEHERKKAELRSVQQFGVVVTLDADTAHPNLVVSDDEKRVHHGNVRQNLPDNPERFYRCVNVLGKQGFSSGIFYFEVQVKRKTAWTLGIAKESIERKGDITLSPEDGFWTIGLRDEGEHRALTSPSICLSLNSQPEKVGVFVNYEESVVSFYDVDTADLLYSYTNCSFTGKLYPFFSPCTNKEGSNSAPLILTPINHPLNFMAQDLGALSGQDKGKVELKRVQQFAVNVTLDSDTAHPNLILSDNGKQVRHGDTTKILPHNPERFDSCVNVLGKQTFSMGKFYFEVQVKGKSAWTVGVAKESISRKGDITLSPKKGFWTMWLRRGNDYMANDNPAVSVSKEEPLQKLGVFVDYEGGLVCFYDVDTADLLYAFTDCNFTGKLVPYFSPCKNDNGANAKPLIITPVDRLG